MAANVNGNINVNHVNNVIPITTSTTTAAMKYETKQTLQKLFNHANEQLVKRIMITEEMEFERKMILLQDRLKEKRRSISKLLGFPLDEDCAIANNITAAAANAAAPANANDVGTVDTSNSTTNDESGGVGGGVGSSSKEEKRSKFPFRDVILLLRRETPKLERAVDGLLLLHHTRNNPQDVNVGVVGRMMSNTTPMKFLDARSMTEEEELESTNVDVVSDYCSSSPSSKLLCSDGHGEYNLASRIAQEDGEEFEIFEKCTGDDA